MVNLRKRIGSRLENRMRIDLTALSRNLRDHSNVSDP